jgi:hypothetical protein
MPRLEGRRSFRRRAIRNSIVIRCFFWALAKGRGYLAVPFRSAYLAASLWVWGKVGGLHACGATFSYIVPPPILLLNPFLSEVGVKRKDFPEVARLTWAHPRERLVGKLTHLPGEQTLCSSVLKERSRSVRVGRGRCRIQVRRFYFSGEDSRASNKAGAFLL